MSGSSVPPARAGFTRIALRNGHGGQVILSRLTSAILRNEDDISITALNRFGLLAKEMARLFEDEKLSASNGEHTGAVGRPNVGHRRQGG